MSTTPNPESLGSVGALLRGHSSQFRDLVHEKLFAQEFMARGIFPLSSTQAHLDLAPSLAWVLERTPRGEQVPEDVLGHIRQLALGHRRHGFPAQLYEAFGEIACASLRQLNDSVHPPLPEHLIDEACHAFVSVTHAMADSASAADRSGLAPACAGVVKSVRRVSSRISVVRLMCTSGPQYKPGQALHVTAAYLPGLWRPLTPANPQDAAGTLDFHIQSVGGGSASGLLAHPKVGDYWTVGAAHRDIELPVDAQRVTFVAFGTGLATATSLVFSLVDKPERPRVHLAVYADYPGELYELARLRRLERSVSWLRISVFCGQRTDPWWVVRPGGYRRSAQLMGAEVSTPHDLPLGIDAVDAYVVCGPGNYVSAACKKLIDNGVEEEKLITASFDRSGCWPDPSSEHHAEY